MVKPSAAVKFRLTVFVPAVLNNAMLLAVLVSAVCVKVKFSAALEMSKAAVPPATVTRFMPSALVMLMAEVAPTAPKLSTSKLDTAAANVVLAVAVTPKAAVITMVSNVPSYPAYSFPTMSLILNLGRSWWM